MTSFICSAHIDVGAGRLMIQTAEKNDYSIAIREGKPLNCFQRLFWKRFVWNNVEYTLNLRSLSKRLGISHFTAFRILPYLGKRLDETVAIFSKFEPFKATFCKEKICSRTKSIVNLIKNMESIRGQLDPKKPVVALENEEGVVIAAKGEKFYATLSRALGQGGFRTFYPLLNYQTGQCDLALGIQEKQINQGMHEYRLLKLLQKVDQVAHPFFSIAEKERFFLALERCEGSLRDFYRDSLQKKIALFKELLKGVISMHELRIVHRDLKPGNIMYKKEEGHIFIKIIDFGLACRTSNTDALKINCGTLFYKAPEVFLKEEKEYPEKLDCWSLGIILYLLCEKKLPPFTRRLRSAKNLEALRQNIKNIEEGVSSLSFKNLEEGSPLISIIEGFLNPDPEKRLSAKDALESLNCFF